MISKVASSRVAEGAITKDDCHFATLRGFTMTTDLQNPKTEDMAEEVIEEARVCYRHPETETGLRCTRCERYICAKCAKRTPVGYICPECQRSQEDRYFNGGDADYILASVVSLPLAVIANFAFILLSFGFFFGWMIALLGAPFVAGFISEAVRRVVQKRRSRYLPHIVIACMIIAALPFFFYSLVLPLIFGKLPNFFAMIPILIFLVAGAGTVRLRLR